MVYDVCQAVAALKALRNETSHNTSGAHGRSAKCDAQDSVMKSQT